MIWRIVILLIAMVAPGWAANVTFTGTLEQGGLLVGTVPSGTKVMFGKRTLPVTTDGRFLLGLHRDAPRTIELVFESSDGVRDTETLSVAPRDWKIERVDGVPQRLVTPDPETVKKIAADSRLMAAARSKIELVPFFDTGFIRPAEGRISGVFGSQRILNGSPRAPHSGLDIAAPVGTSIYATADGVVSLANTEMTLTGQTVFINHGYGLQSLYIHMSAIHVKDGQHVKQGEMIGEIGMTGRATGPHLHFGITWFDTRLDPETVLAALPAKTN